MPTADEFLTVAERVDRTGAAATAALASVERSVDGALVGGTLADRLARTLVEATASSRRICNGLAALADTARERAAECRAFTAAMATYRTDVARWEAAMAVAPGLDAGPVPRRPSRPGPWAEEG